MSGKKLTGHTYLLIEPDRHGVKVSGHRTKKPTQPGVWLRLALSVPESVFGSYQATIELTERDLFLVDVLAEDEVAS